MHYFGSHSSVHAVPDKKMGSIRSKHSTQKYETFAAPGSSVRRALKKSANAKRRRRDKAVEL